MIKNLYIQTYNGCSTKGFAKSDGNHGRWDRYQKASLDWAQYCMRMYWAESCSRPLRDLYRKITKKWESHA